MSADVPDVVNVDAKLALLREHWSPRIVARLNDCDLRIVKFQGEFVWHSHADTDELFLVVRGSMTVHFRERDVRVGAGELVVVPRGVEHKTSASEECSALILERAGTVNTGDAGGEKTAPADRWI